MKKNKIGKLISITSSILILIAACGASSLITKTIYEDKNKNAKVGNIISSANQNETARSNFDIFECNEYNSVFNMRRVQIYNEEGSFNEWVETKSPGNTESTNDFSITTFVATEAFTNPYGNIDCYMLTREIFEVENVKKINFTYNNEFDDYDYDFFGDLNHIYVLDNDNETLCLINDYRIEVSGKENEDLFYPIDKEQHMFVSNDINSKNIVYDPILPGSYGQVGSAPRKTWQASYKNISDSYIENGCFYTEVFEDDDDMFRYENKNVKTDYIQLIIESMFHFRLDLLHFKDDIRDFIPEEFKADAHSFSYIDLDFDNTDYVLPFYRFKSYYNVVKDR